MTHDLNDTMDEDLIALVTKGDHRAFSILVKRHTDKFYALAFRTLGNTRDAEDVVQDCFVKLWKKPSAYKPERGAKFTTWFYRVVFNASIDLKRKHKIVVNDMDETLQDTNFTMQDERLIVARTVHSALRGNVWILRDRRAKLSSKNFDFVLDI